MISRTTARFHEAFADLSLQVRRQAKEAYLQFRQDAQHPSLRFQNVHPRLPTYSARINRDYRAVGVRSDTEIVWFWIGGHAEYEQLLARL